MARLLRELGPLLAAQNNVVGRWQMTPSQVRAARRSVQLQEWQRPANHVYVMGRAPLTTEQSMWAALLHGGAEARLAGRAALVLHGWNQPVTRPIDVVMARRLTRSRTPDWIRLHRPIELAGPSQEPARVDVHTAVIQAAGWAGSDRQAMFIVLSCLQQRLVSADRLLQRLWPHCRRRTLIADLASEFLHGITSVNERDFAALCAGWGLPEPVRQSRVYDASGVLRAIDAEFRLRDGRLRRVEIEGMHHFEPTNFFADVDRHNALIVQGDVYLRVVSYTVKYEPGRLRPILTRWLEREDLPTAS